MKITLDDISYDYTPIMEPSGTISGVILEINDPKLSKRYIFGYKNDTLRYGKIKFKGMTRFMNDSELDRIAKKADAIRVCQVIYQSLQ